MFWTVFLGAKVISLCFTTLRQKKIVETRKSISMADPKDLKKKLKQCKLLLKKLEQYKELKGDKIVDNLLSTQEIEELQNLTQKAAQTIQIELVGEKDSNILANNKKLDWLVLYCKSIQGNKAALNNNPQAVADFFIPAKVLADASNYGIASAIAKVMTNADPLIFNPVKDALNKEFLALSSTGGTHTEVVTALENAANAPLKNINDKLIKALEATKNLAAVHKKIKYPLVQNFFKNTAKYKNGHFKAPDYDALIAVINSKYTSYYEQSKELEEWKTKVLLMLDELTNLVDSHFYYKFEAAKLGLPSFLNVQLNDFVYDARSNEETGLFDNNVTKHLRAAITNLNFFELLEQGMLKEVLKSNILKENFEQAVSDSISKKALDTFNLAFKAWQKAAGKALQDDIEVLNTNYHSCDFDGATFKVKLVATLENSAMSALLPVLPPFKYERKKANQEEFRTLWAAAWETSINGIEASVVLKQAIELVPFVVEEKWKGFLPAVEDINAVIGSIRSEYGITTDSVQDKMIAKNSQKIAANTVKLQELEEKQKEQAAKVEKLEKLAGYNAIFQKITSQLGELVNYKLQMEVKLNQYIKGYIDAKKRADSSLQILRSIAADEISRRERNAKLFELLVVGAITALAGPLISGAIKKIATGPLKTVLKEGKLLKTIETFSKNNNQNWSLELETAQGMFAEAIKTPMSIIESYAGGIVKAKLKDALNAGAGLNAAGSGLDQMKDLKIAANDNFEEYVNVSESFLAFLLNVSNSLRAAYQLLGEVQIFENKVSDITKGQGQPIIDNLAEVIDGVGIMVPEIDKGLKAIESKINAFVVNPSTTYIVEYNIYVDTFNTIEYTYSVIDDVFKNEEASKFFDIMEDVAKKANGVFSSADFWALLSGDKEAIAAYEKEKNLIPQDLKDVQDFKIEDSIADANPRTVAKIAIDFKDTEVKATGELMQKLIAMVDYGLSRKDAEELVGELRRNNMEGITEIADDIALILNDNNLEVIKIEGIKAKKVELVLIALKNSLLDMNLTDVGATTLTMLMAGATGGTSLILEQTTGVGITPEAVKLTTAYENKAGGMEYYNAFLKLKNLKKIPLC